MCPCPVADRPGQSSERGGAGHGGRPQGDGGTAQCLACVLL